MPTVFGKPPILSVLRFSDHENPMTVEKDIVAWLRDHARRTELRSDNGSSLSNSMPPTESEYAIKFADMIEQRFILPSDMKALTSVVRPLTGVTITKSAKLPKGQRPRRVTPSL